MGLNQVPVYDHDGYKETHPEREYLGLLVRGAFSPPAHTGGETFQVQRIIISLLNFCLRKLSPLQDSKT